MKTKITWEANSVHCLYGTSTKFDNIVFATMEIYNKAGPNKIGYLIQDFSKVRNAIDGCAAFVTTIALSLARDVGHEGMKTAIVCSEANMHEMLTLCMPSNALNVRLFKTLASARYWLENS